MRQHILLPLLVSLATAWPAAAQDTSATVLDTEAAQLDVHFGSKVTTGSKLDAKLSPCVRRALNLWAPTAKKLNLTVIVPQKADALVLGHASMETLTQTARWADDTFALFADLRPAADPKAESAGVKDAVVMALFDDAGFQSPAWPGLLDTLVERNYITSAFAAEKKGLPGSFTTRKAHFFTQHTWDMVGNAAAGDDEYRLCNEIAHKTAQMLVEARFGRQPDVLRWGVGYVAEQHLFGNVYQFNSSGFVATGDHFAWPARTADALLKRSKTPNFSLPDTILRTTEPGTPMLGQQCAWGVLDYELTKEPARLASLLAQLGTLHKEGDPRGDSLDYKGDDKRTHEACDAAWGGLKTTALTEYLKHLK